MATSTIYPSHAPTAAPSTPLTAASDSTRSSETLDEKDISLDLPKARKSKRSTKRDVDVDRSVSSKRVTTFWTSFKYLYGLTDQQVKDYLNSYVIFNLDWENEDDMIAALGPDYEARVADCIRAYYGVLNHLCALGDVEKMYIPPLMDEHASVLDNQLLYEESIARDIGLKAGDRVLEIGCGRGRVAAHMAHFSGARVTGLNIDTNQIAQARTFNDEQGLQNTFQVWDLNNLPLPFEDNTFDGFYQIQALSYSKNHAKLFKEINRVLKPGAKFSILDWVSLPAYNPNDPEHVDLMRRVKPLLGAVGTPTPASYEKALGDAGFVVTKSDNASVGDLQAPLIDKVDIYFRGMRQVILGLVRLKMLPKHFKPLINRLCLDGQAFVKLDKMRLGTTSYRIVASKPSSA
jgi:sterol 24-C-methyltransferase